MKTDIGWCPYCQRQTTQTTTVDSIAQIGTVVCNVCNHLLAKVQLKQKEKGKKEGK